jgi:hypothetical protein
LAIRHKVCGVRKMLKIIKYGKEKVIKQKKSQTQFQSSLTLINLNKKLMDVAVLVVEQLSHQQFRHQKSM